ncbi:MAG: hypothetical protein PHH54_04005 [Candidatus Nanoarchaeia archaeon]|nr:hypothetical protein [Candidatus Nanoarchaeia archaeon]MDD5741123.1 hypothetical protein [Candidatus Nanoarchaeia archaeon]
MVNKKIINIEYAIIVSILVMIGSVSAFGSSMPYGMGMPLKLYPGQSIDFSIVLQSSLAEGNLTIIPEISEGQDIVSVTDSLKEYKVVADQNIGALINLKASIPDDAPIGKEYAVKILFKDVTPKAGGMIGLSITTGAGFNVVVVEKPAETPATEGISTVWYILGVIAVIVIIAIIWFVVKNKEK